HWFLFAFDRRDDRVPGQNRAFDARGEFVHAGEHRQLAHAVAASAGRYQIVDFVEQRFHFGLGFSLEGVRENGRRRLRDGAARALKADVLDDVAIHYRVEGVIVAAEWVVALCSVVWALQPAE